LLERSSTEGFIGRCQSESPRLYLRGLAPVRVIHALLLVLVKKMMAMMLW
jgi:hypothetical protein